MNQALVFVFAKLVFDILHSLSTTIICPSLVLSVHLTTACLVTTLSHQLISPCNIQTLLNISRAISALYSNY